jgi:hypothetical protein
VSLTARGCLAGPGSRAFLSDVKQRDLEHILAGKHKYISPTGLIVLFDQPRQPMLGEGWARSPHDLSFPTRPSPSLLDQMVVVCDEAALGLTPPSTVEEVREVVGQLPWAPAMIRTARIARKLWPIRDEPERQLELARELFGEDAGIIEDFGAFLGNPGTERRYLFHEQQLFVLQRLLLESAAQDEGEVTWTAEQDLQLRKALIKVSSAITAGAAKVLSRERDPKDWLGFITQNSAYNSSEQPLLAYQRTWRIYVELAGTAAARAHPNHCDLDQWHRDHVGVSLPELLAVGHGAAMRAEDESAPAGAQAVVPDMQSYLSTTSLAERHATLTEALSASRSSYVEGFERSRDVPVRLAWETTPFLTKPFLRIPGGLCLVAPRAAQGFLTDGVYYRFLEIAAAEKRRDDYTTFVGWLIERYVQELFEEALGSRPAGQGAVHGEQEYSGQLTSDVAIDCGADLVLVEVISTRLPLGVRAEADEAELEKYLKRTVIEKLEQLDRVIDDLLDSDSAARLPGVDMGRVQRIWPVLVTYGDLLAAGPLLAYIADEAGGLLGQAATRPLTLLGLEDVEVLAGMLADGETLADVLAEKNGGVYEGLPFSRWITDTRNEIPPRLPVLEQRWFDMTDGFAALLQRPD